MSRRRVFALAALPLTLVLAPVPAGAAGKLLLVTNDAMKLADCAVVVDGKLRTYLKIRPGKTWGDSFDHRRTVQLVCERTVKDAVWRLAPGTNYRLTEGVAGKLDLAEAAAAE